MYQVSQALTTLAEATTTDRESMANLTIANGTLHEQLNMTNQALEALMLQFATLQNRVTNLNDSDGGRCNDDDDDSYCWTHGRTCNPPHTSATCNHKAEGNKDNTNLKNKRAGEAAAFVIVAPDIWGQP